MADAQDARDALEAADAAWRRGDWAGLKPHQRAAVLHRIADLVQANHEQLAQIQRRDNGKPISETRALVTSAANTFRYFAAAAETFEEAPHALARRLLSRMSVHEPLGVVAAITPWNSPIASDAQKLGACVGGRQRGGAQARRGHAAGLAGAGAALRAGRRAARA